MSAEASVKGSADFPSRQTNLLPNFGRQWVENSTEWFEHGVSHWWNRRALQLIWQSVHTMVLKILSRDAIGPEKILNNLLTFGEKDKRKSAETFLFQVNQLLSGKI